MITRTYIKEATAEMLYNGKQDNFANKIDRETFNKLIKLVPGYVDDNNVGKFARWIATVYIKSSTAEKKRLMDEDAYKIK